MKVLQDRSGDGDSPGSEDEDTDSSSGKAFLGIAHNVMRSSERSLTVSQEFVYRIGAVLPGTAASRAGLMAGDYLLSFDGKILDDYPDGERADALRNFLRHHKSISSEIELDILRLRSRARVDQEYTPLQELDFDRLRHHPGVHSSTALEVLHDSTRFSVVAKLSVRKMRAELPGAETLYPGLEKVHAPHGEHALKLIDKHGLSEDWSQFLAQHARDERWTGQLDGWCDVNLLRYLRLRPEKLFVASHALIDGLDSTWGDWQPGQTPVEKPLHGSLSWLSATASSASYSVRREWRMDDLDALMSQLVSWVEEIGSLRDLAFAALDSDEQAELAVLSQKTRERFVHSFYIDAGDEHRDLATRAQHTRLFALLSRVDLDALLSAAMLAAELRDPELHRGIIALAKPYADNDNQQALLAARTSRYGKVLLGGFADNEYRKPAALLIDVGGRDHYYGAVASALPERPVSMLLDLGGDDRYSATMPFSQGGAHMGVAVLVDRGGDDVYLGTVGTQGSAWIGAAILADVGGNDHYTAQNYAQGAGFMGLGVLSDSQGEDQYRGALYVQGVGGPCGLGLLRDGSGHDDYRSGGVQLSTYEDDVAGSFRSASLGVGIGFRGYVRGGVGVVHDKAGDDYYEVGNFGLGVGYFYGLGLVYDETGNDRYHASRYGLGAAAHSAAGMFVDLRGDDRYDGNFVALIGAGWDLSLAGFMDEQGDDHYMGVARRFNIGVGAHNSFVLMVDASGTDRYMFSGHQQIWANDYHGGTSFAFRYDLGGADEYHGKGANAQFVKTGTHGFSRDLP